MYLCFNSPPPSPLPHTHTPLGPHSSWRPDCRNRGSSLCPWFTQVLQLQYSTPAMQDVQIEDCEGWWLSGWVSSVAEHWWLRPEAPELNWRAQSHSGLTHHSLLQCISKPLSMFATYNMYGQRVTKLSVLFQYLTVSCIPAVGHVPNISRYRNWHSLIVADIL